MALHDSPNSDNFWFKIFSILIATSLLVIPSYITGWISQTNGTLFGFLVPFVACSILIIFVFLIPSTPITATDLIFKWIEKTTLPSIAGGVSGAAGQLHRAAYNKRLHQIAGVEPF